MAELQVLHGEPRYTVENFVDEMTERSRGVIRLMGPQFEMLLRRIVDSLDQFKVTNMLITLRDVHFTGISWQRDGRMILTFAGARLRNNAEDIPRHADIEAFVSDVVGRTVPEEFRIECENFIRGLVFQFALIAKHTSIALRAIRFMNAEWITDAQLAVMIKYHKRPLAPRDVRID